MGKEKKGQDNADLSFQVCHQKGLMQAEVRNQSYMGSQDPEQYDQSLTVTNRRKLGGD